MKFRSILSNFAEWHTTRLRRIHEGASAASKATKSLTGADKIGIAVFSTLVSQDAVVCNINDLIQFQSAVTFGLGLWQYQRYKWKVGIINEGRDKLKIDPKELNENSNLLELQ